MPRFGTFKYGKQVKYGDYILQTTVTKSVGEHVSYRIRTLSEEGKSEYLYLFKKRISLSDNQKRIRIRAKGGEWILNQKQEIDANAQATRIRSVSPNGEKGKWIISTRGEIRVKGEGV